MQTHHIYLVTGAPGSGKSTALAAFLALNTQYVAFDMDWLLEPASQLAGQDIRSAPSTWQPYNRLWFTFLWAIGENHRIPVFFTPLDQHDIHALEQPKESRRIHWLLLDCSDAVRRARLSQRSGWTDALVEAAISDGQTLRASVPDQLDTGLLNPHEVANAIVRWVQQTPGE